MTYLPHEAPRANVTPWIIGAVPVLKTERLTLRAPLAEDYPVLAAILAADEDGFIGGPLEREEGFYDYAQMTATWVWRGHGYWTVTQGDRVIGFCGIGLEPGDQEPELGFLFAKDAEGQGFATEAAIAARDWARAAGVPSLVSYIAVGNDRSAALARRMGAVRDEAAEADLPEDAGVEIWRHAMKGMQ